MTLASNFICKELGVSRENNEMAYVAEVTYVKPILGADAIECAIINDGWPVVVKKDEYKVGELCVYAELDSWIPNTIAPFLSKGKEPKSYFDVKGERLRSIRLRKQLSQGLVLPMSILPDGAKFNLGDRVGNLLGIQKWEPVDGFNAGKPAGNFPKYLRKTDQERAQNLVKEIFGVGGKMNERYEMHERYEISLKLDGSSTQAVLLDDEFVICSRNLKLKTDDDSSTFVSAVKRMFGENGEKLINHKNLSFQMELMGPKICGNRENFTEPKLFVYDIFDIEKQEFISPKIRRNICKELQINHTPVFWEDATLSEIGATDLNSLLTLAEGPSIVNPIREGLVFKSNESQFSFKAVSTKYLETKHD
jgi:RNA ligase (TIGR02306 family)